MHLDYYPSESSGHNSEYNPWFRKRPDLIDQYCNHGTGWNPGQHAYILSEYKRLEHTWRDQVKQWFAEGAPFPLERGEEYAACIINALEGGEPYEFNGNVPNTGLVPNLPLGCCVEVPVLANRKGLNPMYAGALPAQCAAITNLNATVEEMAVEAAVTGNSRLVLQAILHDPLTAAVLSLAEIKEMVDAMFHRNRDYLPQFKSFGI